MSECSQHHYFDDNRPQQDHTGRSLRSGAVSIVARGVNTVVQVGSVLVLARLLSPEDYGLVGMVAAFTGFAPVVVDLGTRDAIVQRTRIERNEVSALFWLTILIGAALTVITAACGPLIARFYGEPRLTAIALVLSLTFIACAMSAQHYALMRRVLRFEELAAIDIGANLFSALIALAIAWLGGGYWALVVRQIATSIFVAVGVWVKCRWLPGRPAFTSSVKDSLKFGLNATGFCMADFAGRSGDRVAIGYRIGAAGLGQYQNSLFLYENSLEALLQPLHNVATASLSKLRHDLSELRAAWGKALATVTFYAMPLMGGLAVVSKDVVVLLLGAKWESAGLLLSVLALRGLPHSIERTLGWLHVTAGRTDRWFKWGLFSTAVHFVALFCGLPFGPMGVVAAYVIAMYILAIPAIVYAGRPLGIRAVDVIHTVWRQFIGALAATGICLLLRESVFADTHAFVRTVVLGLVYVLTYSVIVVGVLKLRGPVQTTQTLVRGYLPARLAHLLS